MTERNGVKIEKVEHLTPSERLVLLRRRLGMNQREMARVLSAAPFTYGRMERGEVPPDYSKTNLEELPPETELSPSERCYFYRIRNGVILQAEIAEKLNVSRIWVNRMERGIVPAEKLVTFWESTTK